MDVVVPRTPAAFKASVETRLKELAGGPTRGQALHRLRVRMVMERFIARLNAVLPGSAVLKGGLALELRLKGARTTKDIDLRMLGNPDALDAQLRAIEAHRPNPEDHLVFRITPDPSHLTVTGEGVKYDGFRFRVEALLAGRRYTAFGLDIAYGDPILGEPDLLEGSDFFERYGIPRVQIRAYPAATHLAEKLHAYTLPRDRVNTRLKDLVDVPLITRTLDGCSAATLRAAIRQTFSFRSSHAVPVALPAPPLEWRGLYDRLQREERLPWKDVDDLHDTAAAFLNPVLTGQEGIWSSAAGRWCLASTDAAGG